MGGLRLDRADAQSPPLDVVEDFQRIVGLVGAGVFSGDVGAALLPADVQLAEAVASRFRLSGNQKKRLALAAARDGSEQDPRALAYRLGRDGALDRLLITGADVSALDGWAIPEFPLKGGEIVARGVKAGPKVAQVLRQVESGWIAAAFDDATIPLLLEAELGGET